MQEKATEKLEGISHIAFIMDGNGRWAKKHAMPREYGHRFGVRAFRKILEYCAELGLSYATFYAFSTENWKRPKKEVDAIMKLMDRYLAECEKNIKRTSFRICFLGDKSVFSEERQKRMDFLERETKENERILNIALNYGGRDEIVYACNRLIKEGKKEVTEEDIGKALYTSSSPDPDLIIRTGGNLRLSNFLLWQSAYAELYFTDVLWPDFGKKELDAAVEEFHTRKRRFGGV